MSKRVVAVREKFDNSKVVELNQFFQDLSAYKINSFVLKNGKEAKFASKTNETIVLEIKLNIDVKKSDQMIKSFLYLKHSHGCSKKALIIAEGLNLESKYNVDIIGSASDLEKIASGSFSLSKYSTCFATEEMIKKISSSGASKALGTKGLMPNQKSGTLLKSNEELSKNIDDLIYKMTHLKTDKFGYLKCVIGKMNSEIDHLKINIIDVIEKVKQLRPTGIKGVFFDRVLLSSTFGLSTIVNHKTI